PVDRPSARRRVEEPKRHADEAAGVARPELVLVSEPAQDRVGHARRLELVPLVGAGERGPKASIVHLPPAHPEVEVAGGGQRWLRGECHVGLLGSSCWMY